MAEVDFAQVFQALPSPFMILDREFRYVAANPAYLATTGRTMDELRGENIFGKFPNRGESGRRLQESFERVLATGEPDTLAYLAYPIPDADGRMTNRYWTAVHVPLFGADGTVEFVMQNTVDVTEYARLREAATLPFTSLSAETSLIERTREAAEASANFRRLFQQAPAFFAVLSGPTHIFTFASDSYLRLVGNREVVGQTVAEALPEVIDQGFIELLDRVFHEGYAHSQESARVMLARTAGRPPEETFLDFSYHPIRDPSGEITGVFVQGMDRTESVRFAQRQRLLIDELNHRVKNTLATVQSIASQSFRSTSDVAAAKRAFEARLVALSQAHNMLSDRQWHDTEMDRLVCQELSIFDPRQVRSSGPSLRVNAKATVALALLIHELATNAARHGSLSNPEGSLAVEWGEDAQGNLVIDWIERGGPPAREPQKRGFGSRLLHTVVTGELGGKLQTRFEDEGFAAHIVLPSEAYIAQENSLV